ncbi:glycosyl hydrolase family 28-related protein [Butyrivibrio proteoclasticus]|uniref:glycosyl hydrolase family 28-related protein n=1 Tax=Butyrivibrio proteoclasticus TaxID=43305 RepID=UPI0006891208|nr:glycosyl hydrolase family 28-related protein [Butyrivibrio proteoclasticus]
MIKKKYLYLLGLAALAGILTGCGKNKIETIDFHSDIFGENVYIFKPQDDTAKVQETLDKIYSRQETAQFGDERYAVYFMPGTYDISTNVGFYTQMSGLGLLPTDTRIKAINTYARWLSDDPKNHNATCNFWRSIENLEMQSDTVWAVSQATGMRRVKVDGNLALHDNYGWASGGFLADSQIEGIVDSGSQQQWLSRNNSYNSWTGQNWNMVFAGDAPSGVPTKTWPEASYTSVPETEIIREKPFLVYDKKDGFGVYVPDWKKKSVSFGWENGSKEGKFLPLDDFYVAKAGIDTAGTVNQALADGKNILFTPGIYEFSETLTISKPGTIVLGMGLATIRSSAGNTCITTENADDLILAGLLLDAGASESDNLLYLSAKDNAAPSLLADMYFRIGGIPGDKPAKAKACITIDLDNTVGDNLWVWRADHGDNVGWDLNSCPNGIIINGNNVTMYALMVEHFNEYQTMWNGNNGTCIMYQSEVPYDVPDKGKWINPDGKRFGYASFKVSDNVSSFTGTGIGIYLYNRDNTIPMYCAMEVPNVQGVHVHNIITVCLNGFPGMKCVINEAGDSVINAGQTSKILDYENGEWK